MNEAEALLWLEHNHVPRETRDRLATFITLLEAEADRQNLVSHASLPVVWARHIVDSAQLLVHAPSGSWVDLGSGAGLPGLIVAMIGNRAVTLVEPRRRRVEFLSMATEALGLAQQIEILPHRVETLDHARRFDVISARAFAPLPRLLAAAWRLAAPHTRWILPKGQSAVSEVEAARHSWQGRFELVPSITDPAAAIIVASDVRPRRC